ncbi:MAG: hypothetical protein GY714_10555 [Desulfobacterales bacterium]|nr:hypothetical protein [Desulfobacterales bacterium]
MKNEYVYSRCYNETMRIDEIIHLVGAAGAHQASGQLLDFFTDHTEEEITSIFGEKPRMIDSIEEDGDKYEDLAGYEINDIITEFINDQKQGFLVHFATPVFNDGSYSWGRYTTQWIYADTYEEVFKKGLDFVKECRNKGK